jgi:hypothetical protein
VTVVEIVARARVGTGSFLQQLVCHPRLPLVAGIDSARPAVHIWDGGAGQLSERAIVGAESAGYGDAAIWERERRMPAVAWHPDEPLLMIAAQQRVLRWTPAGLAEPEGVPAGAGYRSLAFSPDGRALWASPSSGDGPTAWLHSDVIDLASGTISTGPRWDTGVSVHPAGGVAAALRSDQGATLGLFAQVDHESAPSAMRVLRRALILDVDGYQAPVFSADGRHLAIRGNAYENTVDVFEFPSLQRVLATTLGEANPGYPYPQEWLDRMRAWSRHNIAFGADPGVLWIGTPDGTLVEVAVADRSAVEQDVLAGSPVTALGALATGELVVAGGEGELLLSKLDGSGRPEAPRDDAMRATVTAFLDSTSEVLDDGDPEDLAPEHVVTDGARTWKPADLATVTTAAAADPTWLQLQAAINARNQGK